MSVAKLEAVVEADRTLQRHWSSVPRLLRTYQPPVVPRLFVLRQGKTFVLPQHSLDLVATKEQVYFQLVVH